MNSEPLASKLETIAKDIILQNYKKVLDSNFAIHVNESESFDLRATLPITKIDILFELEIVSKSFNILIEAHTCLPHLMIAELNINQILANSEYHLHS